MASSFVNRHDLQPFTMHFPTILTVLIPLLFNAVGFFLLSIGIRQIRTARAARNWPSTDARLEKCEVESRLGSNTLIYDVSVKYSYAVAGNCYTGDTVAIGYYGSNKRGKHDAKRRQILDLKPFTVRYDPDHPGVSTIFASENSQTFGIAVMGLFWLVGTAGFTAAVLAISGARSAVLEWIATAFP